MSDKDLSDALLKLDLGSAGGQTIPTAQQIDAIVARDRRRVKWLTRVTVGLWILAALGVLFVFVFGGLVFPMIAKALTQAGEGSMENPDTPFLMLAKFTAMSIVFGSLSFFTLVAAGLATVVLMFRSRGATLRQINANLLQISEQLKRGKSSGGEPKISP